MIKKIGRVCRHEFRTVLNRRSAQVIIFILPLVTLLGMALVNLAARPQLPDDLDINNLGGPLTEGGFDPGTLLSDFVREERDTTLPVGVVDLSNQIETYPSFVPEATLVPFASQSDAYRAFRQGDIRGYYVIPATFPHLDARETITLHTGRWEPVAAHQQSLYELLLVNFVAEAEMRIRLLAPTASLEMIDLNRPHAAEFTAAHYLSNLTLVFFISILFYLTVMGAAGYLLQNLSEEKHNRILEILLSSLRPGELLVGKLLGLGAIGLVQIATWSLLWYLLFGSQDIFSHIPLPQLSPLTWGLIVAHFLVGYLVYGAIYASVGTIIPTPKESSQYTFLIALPVFVPLMLLGAITGAPNSKVALVLSLFPLTAPLTMPMRLVVTAVPPLQWLLSLSLSLATAVVALWIATRLFRSHTLLAN
ncbi:MAG: ABC transporter permease [Chloroflexota bacterium]